MLYSIVIADDDRTICKGLSMIIEKYCPKLNVAGIFFNGDDLFDYLKSHRVSIVLSDIVVPGKTGIEIAEYVKKKYPETFVVLITGHRIFDFAKSAIDAKVDYFFTKPYTTEKLIQKLNEICEKIDECSIEAKNLTDTYMKRWHYTRDMVYQFYKGVISPDEISNIDLCAATIPLKCLKCALVTIRFNQFDNSQATAEQTNLVIGEFGVFDSFTLSAIPMKTEFPNYTIIVFYVDNISLLNFVDDMKKSIFSTLKINTPHEICFLDSFNLAYDFEHINKLSSDFAALILQNNPTIHDVDKIFNDLDDTQVYCAVYNIVKKLNDLRPGNTFKLPSKYSRDAFINFLHKIAEQNNPSTGPLYFIKNFQEYMQTNYTRDSLTLKQVADKLQISSDYLSRLLKTHLGVTFTSYLLNKRIEQAKYLLKNTTLPINRISHEIGYPNEKYFRRVFFNSVGCSPRDYRKNPLGD